MNIIDFGEYIQDNFNVSSPDELSEHEIIQAYESLKRHIIAMNLPPDEYTRAIIRLSEYLGF